LPGRDFPNIHFRVADVFDRPFPDDHFDHLFVCFLPGSTWGIRYMPSGSSGESLNQRARSPSSRETTLRVFLSGQRNRAVGDPVPVELQAEAGGNAMIGRQLYPLLTAAGYEEVAVTPRQVYADASRPQYVEGFN